jgi:hypothetical protein
MIKIIMIVIENRIAVFIIIVIEIRIEGGFDGFVGMLFACWVYKVIRRIVAVAGICQKIPIEIIWISATCARIVIGHW